MRVTRLIGGDDAWSIDLRAGSTPALPESPLSGVSRLRKATRLVPQGSDALLVAAVLALATGLLAYLPGAFSVDSWLALATGRDIWQHGLPFHETLTVVSHGVRWVDQQWLSQLLSYALYKLGGLGFLGLVNMALIVAAVGGAVISARRLGAAGSTVMLLLPLCVWLMIPAREVRTQEFVIPLFVLTVYLLATDSRRHSRRVFWCLPILVLWANLHGTAVLGAGLVSLRGITLALDRREQLLRHLSYWRAPLLLVVGAPLCLLVTPYGLHVVSYYHDMLLNSSLKHAVTEWQPITSQSSMAWPFFALAGIGIWSFGRQPSATTLWDRLALIALAFVSISVIRNVLFFALCALVLVPVSLSGALGARRRTEVKLRARINTVALGAAVFAALVATVATLGRPQAQFESKDQRPALLDAVRSVTQANPTIKVFADVRFADWLLWKDPRLAGRIANDARFELLTAHQMSMILRVFAVVGTGWKSGARGYRLVVIDRKYDPDAAKGFLSEAGSRVVYGDGERLVILRSARAANS